jgi:dihydrofolate synthase/folylpolyglutamate synthase
VVTNVGLDHAEVIGPSLADIAREKAGIVGESAALVLGERDRALADIFCQRHPATVWRRDDDFGCEHTAVALGGRVFDLFAGGGRYPGVFVPLHGAHQGDNAAAALAAVQLFFGWPLDPDVVGDAFAAVRVPGRCEVVSRHPLVLLDGAHNPDGARALARALGEDFAGRAPNVIIAGFTAGKDPLEMLGLLGARAATVLIACPPPHPRAVEPEVVAAAGVELGLETRTEPTVEAAVDAARRLAGPDDAILITGSLYVVGAARSALSVGD